MDLNDIVIESIRKVLIESNDFVFIKIPHALTADQHDRIVSQFERIIPDVKGRVIILENGADIAVSTIIKR